MGPKNESINAFVQPMNALSFQFSLLRNEEEEEVTEARKKERNQGKGMLSVKLVRSLVLGETINNSSLLPHNHNHDAAAAAAAAAADDGVDEQQSNNSSSTSSGRRGRRRSKGNTTTITKTPLLLFLPTRELVKDTYRLATIARDMGMDLYPNPSLSHIIFTWPSSSSSSLPLPLAASSSLWSSSSSSWPSSTSTNAVPLPFPLLTTTSITHLHSFVSLSKGLFKVVFYKSNNNNNKGANSEGDNNNNNISSNWDCSSLSLFSRVTGDRIDSMDSFSRVLAGMGWTLFKTKKNPSTDSSTCGPNSVYLFRKLDSNRVQALKPNNGSSSSGEFRVRELRLPPLDFRNAPLRILQYILLMTDDVFYLA